MIIIENTKFYTILETAKILEVSPMTVRRYIHSGKLTSVKVGHYLISQKEINRILGLQD